MFEHMHEGEALDWATDDDITESVRFAEACGIRVFWVHGLREGALYLASFGVVLMDVALPRDRCRRVLQTALSRVRV